MAKDKICTPFLALASPENKFTVNTIEDMQSRKYLKIGDVVELNGYYTAGDGAGHKRKIESADDGSGVQLANGLWANIVHSGEVNVSWFGAKGDGVADDTIAIYKSFNVSKVVNFENTIYNVESLVKVSKKQTTVLKGNGATIRAKKGQTTTNSLFVFEEIEHVAILDVVFSGGADTLEPASQGNANNLVVFESCNVVKMQGVIFDDFNSFYTSDLYSNIFEINNSDTVELNNVKQLACFPEGGILNKCKNVTIDNFYTEYIIPQQWTLLHLIEVDKAYIKNSTFGERLYETFKIGSTVNLTCTDITIDNCVFSGGKGLDFGYELPLSSSFLQKTATIKNSYIHTNNLLYTDLNIQTLEKISFLNCTVKCSAEARFINIDNVLIDSCDFNNVGTDEQKTHLYFAEIKKAEVLNSLFVGKSSFVRTHNNISLVVRNNDFSKISNAYPHNFYNSLIYSRTGASFDYFEFTNNISYKNMFDTESNENVVFTESHITGNIIVINKLKVSFNNLNFDKNRVDNTGTFDFDVTTKLDVGFNYFVNQSVIDIIGNAKVVVSHNYFNNSTVRIKSTIEDSDVVFIANDCIIINRQSYSLSKTQKWRGNFRSKIFLSGSTKDCYTDSFLGDFFYDTSLNKMKFKSTNGWVNVAVEGIATLLDTPYYATQMQEEGVYEDFIRYMDEKTDYDRLQRELEQQRQLAFEQRENQEKVYEEWLAEQPMMLPAKEEPQPSEKLLTFKEKYLG